MLCMHMLCASQHHCLVDKLMCTHTLSHAWQQPVLKPRKLYGKASQMHLPMPVAMKQAPGFEALHKVPAEVEPFMPALSGFKLLTLDCLAQGGGLQLKRGLLCCW